MAKLTPKQKLFVDEYLIDLNATQAAIRAGYSKKTAYRTGADNLKKPQIQEHISQRMKDREKRTEITQDRVLQEYAKIAFFDPRKLFKADGSPLNINEIDDETAGAIAGLDVLEEYEGSGEDREFVGYTKKYKVSDKVRVLDSLAKHLGMFTDQVEIKGEINNPMAGLTTEELKILAKKQRINNEQ